VLGEDPLLQYDFTLRPSAGAVIFTISHSDMRQMHTEYPEFGVKLQQVDKNN
jgi:hypothetical protein